MGERSVMSVETSTLCDRLGVQRLSDPSRGGKQARIVLLSGYELQAQRQAVAIDAAGQCQARAAEHLPMAAEQWAAISVAACGVAALLPIGDGGAAVTHTIAAYTLLGLLIFWAIPSRWSRG